MLLRNCGDVKGVFTVQDKQQRLLAAHGLVSAGSGSTLVVDADIVRYDVLLTAH